MSIAASLERIQSALPAGVTLVAVSKFHPVATVMDAYNAGHRIFGESHVQELTAKQQAMPHDVEWHFIGTLQTNKVKYIAPFISLIHSVDSVRLLQEIDRQAARCGRTIRVLLEIHIAAEESKHGFTPDECRAALREGLAAKYPHVSIVGLMGMATFTNDSEQVRREFESLRALFDEIQNNCPPSDSFNELSIGMSDDYAIAIECGSTMVRIGTAIFGLRS